MFLNVFAKIDKNNKDFNNVYNWFIDANYLDLGDSNFENTLNNRIFLKIIEDEKYKGELLKFIKTFDITIDSINIYPNSLEE